MHIHDNREAFARQPRCMKHVPCRFHSEQVNLYGARSGSVTELCAGSFGPLVLSENAPAEHFLSQSLYQQKRESSSKVRNDPL